MAETEENLRTLYKRARTFYNQLDALQTNARSFNENLQRAIATFEECRQLTTAASIFSPNEQIDDVASNDIQYMSIDYFLGDLLLRNNSGDRKRALRQSQDHFGQFLSLTEQYEIISKQDAKLYQSWQENKNSFSVAPSDPVRRREVKIARLKYEKDLKQKLEFLGNHPDYTHGDESAIRQMHLAELSMQIHQTFASLEGVTMELTVLAMAPDPNEQVLRATDSRERQTESGAGYSERLDQPLSSLVNRSKSGALLSKDGKPLQPFVLTTKRQDLRDGVFRPGHRLPTMSIDEYLEEEKRRGGIIEGGGEKSGIRPEIDEDDHEALDRETMKQRDWDEFKEENPRGSGNTLNRG